MQWNDAHDAMVPKLNDRVKSTFLFRTMKNTKSIKKGTWRCKKCCTKLTREIIHKRNYLETITKSKIYELSELYFGGKNVK